MRQENTDESRQNSIRTSRNSIQRVKSWQFTKELPPEKETEIVNHLKTLAPRVKDSDIDRLLREDFADLMKQKHSGGKDRFNRAKYIAERIGRSEHYIRNRIAEFQKKSKLQKLKNGDLPLNIPQRDEVKTMIRKYRKILAQYQAASAELSELKHSIREITDLPISFLISLHEKGEL